MYRTRLFVAAIVGVLALAPAARANDPHPVPQSICMQGYLEDLAGAPVNGQVCFEVCLFEAEEPPPPPAPNTPLWCTPVPICVTLADGLFALDFGDMGLTPSLFTGQRWLEIKTGGEVMSPRIKLRTAPYAFRVGLVDNPELTDNIELGSATPGKPGSLTIFDSSGAATITALGEDSDGFSILSLFNGEASNQETITIDGHGFGDAGELTLLQSDGTTGIRLRAAHNTFGQGTLVIYNDENLDTIGLDGSFEGFGGKIYLRTNGGNRTVEIDADIGSGGGHLKLRNGANVASQNTLTLDGNDGGDGGAKLILRNAGQETITLDGKDSFGAGLIWLRNSAGQIKATIAADDGTGVSRIAADFLCGAGCDVAETFELTDRNTIKPGMVLVIDPDQAGNLKTSTQAYDKRVAGIVSGAGGLNPGVRLGERIDGSNDLPIALSGRVYCYADATEHAIEIGDLLTTSNTPGHAMKALDRDRAFGAVLGKAMQPLEKGKRGLVLVLVALQ